jgi:hypothetical protein
MVFPVTILLFLINADFPQKLHLYARKGIINNKKYLSPRRRQDISYISLPISRGSNGDSKQAVLLTSLHRSSGLPSFPVTLSDLLCVTVAGPSRIFTGLPY